MTDKYFFFYGTDKQNVNHLIATSYFSWINSTKKIQLTFYLMRLLKFSERVMLLLKLFKISKLGLNFIIF